MGFDADAFRRALVPWTLTLDGVTYTETPVSLDAVRRFKLAIESPDAGAQTHAVERLMAAAFPWRPHYVWRGHPVRKFMALDSPTQAAALADFFALLAARWAPPPSKMTGADSKP